MGVSSGNLFTHRFKESRSGARESLCRGRVGTLFGPAAASTKRPFGVMTTAGGPAAPVGVAAGKKVFHFFIRDVRETHRTSTGEP